MPDEKPLGRGGRRGVGSSTSRGGRKGVLSEEPIHTVTPDHPAAHRKSSDPPSTAFRIAGSPKDLSGAQFRSVSDIPGPAGPRSRTSIAGLAVQADREKLNITRSERWSAENHGDREASRTSQSRVTPDKNRGPNGAKISQAAIEPTDPSGPGTANRESAGTRILDSHGGAGHQFEKPSGMPARQLTERCNVPAQKFSRLPEPLSELFEKVAMNDVKGIAEFLNRRPDTVNDPAATHALRGEAVAGMATRNTHVTDTCVRALGMILFCATSSRQQASELFTKMIRQDEDINDTRLKSLIDREKRVCTAQYAIGCFSGLFCRSSESKEAKRQSERMPATALRKGQSKQSPSKNILQSSQTGDIQIHVSESFRKRPSRFFAPGSMFATVEHDVFPSSVLAGSLE